jgi:hypothetical protein
LPAVGPKQKKETKARQCWNKSEGVDLTESSPHGSPLYSADDKIAADEAEGDTEENLEVFH